MWSTAVFGPFFCHCATSPQTGRGNPFLRFRNVARAISPPSVAAHTVRQNPACQNVPHRNQRLPRSRSPPGCVFSSLPNCTLQSAESKVFLSPNHTAASRHPAAATSRQPAAAALVEPSRRPFSGHATKTAFQPTETARLNQPPIWHSVIGNQLSFQGFSFE